MTFQHHLLVLREFLLRLRKAHLTAKPSKCYIGFSTIECLGHLVGGERLRPDEGKVDAISKVTRPETKRQIKSFLGMVGFYRKFIPNFAQIAVPLTDLTKKVCQTRFNGQRHMNMHSSI